MPNKNFAEEFMGYMIKQKDSPLLMAWLDGHANRWHKNGYDRYYFSESAVRNLIDLEFEYSRTGEIYGATTCDDVFSSLQARKYNLALSNCQFYLDCNTFEIECQCESDFSWKDYADDIAAMLRDAIDLEVGYLELQR